MKAFAYFILILIILTACSVDKRIIWIQQAGDVQSEANGFSIDSDTLGYIYVTGNYSNKLTFPGGTTIESNYFDDDAFIAKYDKDGLFQWVQSITGFYTETGTSVVVDDNQDLVVVGNFWREIQIADTTIESRGNSDIFIAKYNNQGGLIWYRVIGGNWMDDAHEVKVDDLNNIYVVGRLSDTVIVDDVVLKSHGEIDGVIMKFDPQGKIIFGKTLGGKEDDDIDEICFGKNGDLIVSGVVSDSVFYDGKLILSTGLLDQYFANLDTDGNLNWIKTYGEDFLHEIWDMGVDKSGNIYLTGFHSGPIKIEGTKYQESSNRVFTMYIAKFFDDGTLDWFNQYLSKGNGYGHSIAIDEDNTITLSGSFYKEIQIGGKKYKTKNGSGNILLVFNHDGDLLDEFIMTNNQGIDLWRINISKNDNSIIGTGTFTGKFKDLKTGDKKDILVVKLRN